MNPGRAHLGSFNQGIQLAHAEEESLPDNSVRLIISPLEVASIPDPSISDPQLVAAVFSFEFFCVPKPV
jgi:hypothetical protein